MTQGSKNEEVHLSQGPFMRGADENEEEETKLEETEKDMRDVEKSGKFNTDLIIGGLYHVAQFIVCLTIIFIYYCVVDVSIVVATGIR